MGKKKNGFRLKPVSRNPSHAKLRALKCFDEVYERICGGWPMTQLARFIQEERNEYTDIKQTQLEYLLREFRKTIPAGDLVAKRFPEVFEDAMERVGEGLNELDELQELYRIQMHRIGIDFRTETKINKLMPSMTSEIREARQLLESIAELKMDMGVNNRAPTQHQVNVDGQVEATLSADLVDKFPDGVKKVLENPEQRRRVQGLVDRFMSLGAGEDKAESEPST